MYTESRSRLKQKGHIFFCDEEIDLTMKTDLMAYKWVNRQTSTQKLYYLMVCTGLLNKKKIKMVRPTGTHSVFKRLQWKEQMDAIQNYIDSGVYPDSILIGINANERKNRKCDFRKACDSFKVINGKLRKLKIARKYKDAPSESMYCSA